MPRSKVLTPAPSLAGRVIAWQRQAGRRGLPWQDNQDPYRVWLSEVMLQQTQVATVLTYYDRFLNRFPTVDALAQAPLDDVLSLWSGLGYYSRARNLHRCAQVVVEQHGGRFPASSTQLAALPGIGRSTAAAIAAFCFGERAAILDGNVKRVLCRALGFDADLALSGNEQRLWQLAEQQLPERGIEAYTQGLMDLGATLCTSRNPQCPACPLAEDCVAHAARAPERYPVKSRRLKRGQRSNALLWVQHEGHHWLMQRPSTGVWSGLWSFPEFDGADALDAHLAPWPGEGQVLPPLRHVLTHFDWTLQATIWRLPTRLTGPQRKQVENVLGSGAWYTTHDALTLGLPAPIRRWLAQEVQRA